ncbi:MAG: tetratricopeptide repeat protein [Verrucomicrobia bacterium]|nr:tetratricopeptide repeat protein [Verrucomicrobiota bacterium]
MRILLCWLFLIGSVHALSTPSSIYSTLDPTSVTQHLAFYELYPNTPEGRKALKHAWDLLSGGRSQGDPELILPSIDLQPIIAFVNRSSQEGSPVLNEEQLAVIDKLGKHLGNRKLKGYGSWDLKAVLKMKPEEVDLARGLFLAEMEIDPDSKLRARSYEASIDLMALQILARLTPQAEPLEKVRAINDYIFNEMRFRFPPKSLYAKDIDMYTMLPAVLDSRRGVCLGVSILYLCLAQRLELQLQAITPPGHIYVRYVDPKTGDITNIETTARGIDVPSEHYLGLETRKLQQRSIREVVGLAFINQAAVSWHKEDSKTAVKLYERAKLFIGDDYLLNMFLGFNYLFNGQEKEGRKLLEKIKGVVPDHMIAGDTVAEDYLKGNTDVEGIQAIYSEVDESRASILKKQKRIEAVLAKYPKFRQGYFHLAITWLQLGRYKEALPILERYIRLCPEDPSANYYLSAIFAERHNYIKAWGYLRAAEKLVHAKDHKPRALKELRQGLLRICPEPN